MKDEIVAWGCFLIFTGLIIAGCSGCLVHITNNEEKNINDKYLMLQSFCSSNKSRVRILYYTEGQEGTKYKFQVVYCVVEGSVDKERRILRVSTDENNSILPLPNEFWLVDVIKTRNPYLVFVKKTD